MYRTVPDGIEDASARLNARHFVLDGETGCLDANIPAFRTPFFLGELLIDEKHLFYQRVSLKFSKPLQKEDGCYRQSSALSSIESIVALMVANRSDQIATLSD